MSGIVHREGATKAADPSPATLWLLATMPLDSAIVAGLVQGLGLGQAAGQGLTWVMFIAAFRWDLHAFRSVYPDRAKRLGWWFLFFPAYMWKRCRRGGGSMAPFWTYLGMTAVIVLVAVLAAASLAGKRHASLTGASMARARSVLAAPSFPEDVEDQKRVVDDVLRDFPRDARARLVKARILHDGGSDGEARAILEDLVVDRREMMRFPREGYDAVALLARLRVADGDVIGANDVARHVCLSDEPESSAARKVLNDQDLCPPSRPSAPGTASAVASGSESVGTMRGSASRSFPSDRFVLGGPAASGTGGLSGALPSSRAERKRPGVEEVLRSVTAQGLPSRSVEGWTIYEDARRHASWIFPDRSDPAWPALAISRHVVPGAARTGIRFVCESDAASCSGFEDRARSLEARAFGGAGDVSDAH